MGVLEYSVWIKATPTYLWQVYVDPGRLPQWQTGNPVIVDVHGAPGEAGSGYTSRRGPLSAKTIVVAADAPHVLVTRTEAYLGLEFELTSRLIEQSGGTELRLRAVTHWRRGFAPVIRVVEKAILNAGEARKELANLKTLIEQEAPSST